SVVVVVAKLDRLFRSVADAAKVIADFGKKGIELIAIAEGFDMTSPYGRAMAQMASVFAELERAMIGERTRDALRHKQAKGERTGRIKYGYLLDATGIVISTSPGSFVPVAYRPRKVSRGKP